MAYKDLREYIDALEKAGELQQVEKEVDWNLEIGAITRRVQDLWSPAPFFEKITGYPGFKILSAPASLSSRNKYARIALALGMSPETSVKEIINKYHLRHLFSSEFLEELAVLSQVGNSIEVLYE